MRRVSVIDATLREGNQAPGVRFSVEQSMNIAKMLDDVGVDMIECSHPLANDLERVRVLAVASMGLRTPILSHARARAEDIQAVRDCGAQWVGIFCGVNRISRLTRLGDRDAESVIDLIRRAIGFAKSIGLLVRYTVEDGTRTPLELVARVLQVAVAEGADRICYADTLGAMTPTEFGNAIRCIRESVPTTDLEVHVHDDRGFAMANAWAAIECGANWISTSVNGVGERCGITDLGALMANLDLSGSRPLINPASLQYLARYVGAVTRSPPDDRRPIVGRNSFTHTAHLHTEAVKRTPVAYAVFDAERFGRQLQIAEPPSRRQFDQLHVSPKVISATELKFHRHGPGSRYVMIDERFVSDARQYCIVRDIPHQLEPADAHVDPHSHSCDSLFMFLGREDGLTGLTVEVMLDGQSRTVLSPAAVFIPAGVEHSYRVVGGSGLYVNHVLAGDYNSSLLSPQAPSIDSGGADESKPTPASDFDSEEPEDSLRRIVARIGRRAPSSIDDDMDLVKSGVLDSIGMLELFLQLEEVGGRPIDASRVTVDNLRSLRRIRDILQPVVDAGPVRP